MTFALALTLTKIDMPRLSAREYDTELDDVNSIFWDLCEALHESGALEFQVSGFGEDRWRVDVGTDLLTVLGQLPDALAAVRARSSSFMIDFYEQGTERQLDFQLNGVSYDITCWSHISRSYMPRGETTKLAVLDEMLSRLMLDFMGVVKRVSPELARHPWIEQWSAAAI